MLHVVAGRRRLFDETHDAEGQVQPDRSDEDGWIDTYGHLVNQASAESQRVSPLGLGLSLSGARHSDTQEHKEG